MALKCWRISVWDLPKQLFKSLENSIRNDWVPQYVWSPPCMHFSSNVQIARAVVDSCGWWATRTSSSARPASKIPQHWMALRRYHPLSTQTHSTNEKLSSPTSNPLHKALFVQTKVFLAHKNVFGHNKGARKIRHFISQDRSKMYQRYNIIALYNNSIQSIDSKFQMNTALKIHETILVLALFAVSKKFDGFLKNHRVHPWGNHQTGVMVPCHLPVCVGLPGADPVPSRQTVWCGQCGPSTQ